MTDSKPYRHRTPISIIEHAVWLYHRCPLRFLANTACTTIPGRSWDERELLHQHGLRVSHDTLRGWCINCDPLFAEDLRRGFHRHLNEMAVKTLGVKQ
nr:hypothetical protein [Deinococcus peraridilitoris]